MKGMNQLHAVAILESAHERRARELGSESSAEILTDLAIEDMRRGIHHVYLSRCTKVLMCAGLIVVIAVYFGSVQLSRHTEDLKRIYLVSRGLPEATTGAVVRDVAKKVGVAGKEGFRAWLKKKLNKGEQPNQ